MNTPLRLLIVEDRPVEAELMIAELRRSGLDPQWKCVDNEPEFRASVAESWDVILADFSLPQFSALRALEVLAEAGVRSPVIVVTGAVGEEAAADCIKRGAVDYLLKDRLTRLPAAVKQALEQKRMREESAAAHCALRENEERFRALVEHSSNGILLLHPSGRVLHRYNDLFPGRDGDHWYPDSFLEWMLAEDRPAARQMWDRLPEGIQTVQFRISDRNGGIRWLEAVGNDLRGMAAVGAIIVHYRDVTDRHQLEEQFRHAQKMEAVGQLAAGLGHDFNNLLTVIRGHSDLLLKHPDPSAPLKKGLTEIQAACLRATRLTHELLTFSRKQTGHAGPLDANRVISELAPLLTSLLGEIDFRADLEDGLGAVRFDEGQLEQVIMNLVVNARDATAGSGSIAIATRTVEPGDPRLAAWGADGAAQHILFSVSDTGSGMDPQTAARIFEPFFTTKDVGKGTGLGLSTVYAMVTNAGGRIFVESQLGKGSTFKVLLPRMHAAPAAESPGDALPAPAGASARETILLVEDDDSIRGLMVAMLQPLGYRLITAGSASEALGRWESGAGHIDLLITDVRMAGVKGPELAQALRKEQPVLKVLFISGCAGEEDVGEEGLAGSALLLKPFSHDTLVKKVRDVLDSTATLPPVLIVDDDPQVLDLLRAILEDAGYRVEAANNGRRALELLKSAHPEIVITDIVMPGIEGIELIRMMRKAARGLKIIAMSGAAAQGSYLEGARLLGADATVGKPLAIDTLLTSVRDLLAAPGAKKLEPARHV